MFAFKLIVRINKLSKNFYFAQVVIQTYRAFIKFFQGKIPAIHEELTRRICSKNPTGISLEISVQIYKRIFPYNIGSHKGLFPEQHHG